ncbi:MAG: hypothetical protein WBA23_25910, partial [Tunicatimonas sp.]
MMIYRYFIAFFSIGILLGACAQSPQAQSNDVESSNSNSRYSSGNPTSTDGTGKFYMGRDIAQVMGHLGA